MKNILFIFGTRPEAIKMMPVIKELQSSVNYLPIVCVSGQHSKLLTQVMELFEIKPDYNLRVMQKNQSLEQLTKRILIRFEKILEIEKPSLIIVHGDTTTAFAGALGGFYKKIPVAHVEAGLRTNNIYSPWPEEMNRRLISSIATIHFTPTLQSQKNLLKENIPKNNIFLTGNTVIDALKITKNLIDTSPKLLSKLKNKFKNINFLKDIILVTGHRRENFGQGFKQICQALIEIAKLHQDIQIVYPVHLNPNVKDVVKDMLSGFQNIKLLDPLDYISFVFLMSNAKIILTDSGGIQEEAPYFGVPVIVMRENTERPEGIEAGTVVLSKPIADQLVATFQKIYLNEDLYNEMSKATNPYGDGNASKKIVRGLKDYEKRKTF